MKIKFLKWLMQTIYVKIFQVISDKINKQKLNINVFIGFEDLEDEERDDNIEDQYEDEENDDYD